MRTSPTTTADSDIATNCSRIESGNKPSPEITNWVQYPHWVSDIESR